MLKYVFDLYACSQYYLGRLYEEVKIISDCFNSSRLFKYKLKICTTPTTESLYFSFQSRNFIHKSKDEELYSMRSFPC